MLCPRCPSAPRARRCAAKEMCGRPTNPGARGWANNEMGIKRVRMNRGKDRYGWPADLQPNLVPKYDLGWGEAHEGARGSYLCRGDAPAGCAFVALRVRGLITAGSSQPAAALVSSLNTLADALITLYWTTSTRCETWAYHPQSSKMAGYPQSTSPLN